MHLHHGLRRRLAVFLTAALAAGGVAVAAIPTNHASAAPPAPVILNNGTQNSAGNAQWAETQGLPDDGGVRAFWATFLVQHAEGRTIPNVRIDADFNGSDNTAAGALVPVASQTFVAAAGGIQTSRVTVSVNVGKPGGFGCPIIGTRVRQVDAPIRMQVVDSTTEPSATVTTTVRFTEDSNCLASQDYPRLTAASQNLTEVTPGQAITYTFACDDADLDVLSSDDECERANIRWRRLNDGAVSGITLKTGMGDNATQTHAMSFPERGYYVVEAQLGNEGGGFPSTGAPTGGWVRLGNAVVNPAASTLSGSLAFTGSQPSSPPSVNPGTTVSAVATVADTGGAVQAIEWNANAHVDGSFERREYTVPTRAGSPGAIVHPALSAAQRTQGVDTSTPGLKTVGARITDNGAFDAADNIRRQLAFSGQLRVNALPTASNLNVATPEDVALPISLAGSDADSQPDPLTYSIVTGVTPAAAGTLGAVSGNHVTFTPAPNYFGPASFTYRVADGSGSTVGAWAQSAPATVNINVTPVNDVPIVDPASITTAEDTPGDVQMSGFDIEDGTNLTYTVESQPVNGTASCTPTGLCTYTPDDDVNGSDSFVVRGTDSEGAFATATVSVTVTAVNDAPVANDQTVAVPEDSVNFPITVTGSDIDSVTLAFTAPISGPSNGALSCLGGSCTYTPDADYNGPDSFTFQVSDGQLTDTGTVTIDVTAVNDAPVATDVPDAETDEDTPVTLTLGGTDVDGDPVTIDSVVQPAHGSVAIDGPNQVTYTPNPNFFGVDTFDFVVTDGNGGFDTGTVMVTVHPVNDAPEIDDQAFTVAEDSVSILSLVAGDVDGDLLTWTVPSGPAHGNLYGTGPDVAYAPHADFHGTDTFVVQVSDGTISATATVTVTVTPVNDAPVANAASATTPEDTPVDVTLTGTDIDGDTLTFSVLNPPANGGVTLVGNVVSYTPGPDFHGVDQLIFLVDDGNGGADNASVTITVTPVNDQPVASPVSATTPEDTAVAVSLVAFDVDGDLLTYTYGAAANGTVLGSGAGAVYVPNPNFAGTDGFSFTVDDGNGGEDTALVEVTVTPVNDAPVATGGSVTTAEDVPVSFQLGGTDVEGDPLTFAVSDPPESGTLVCLPDGACTYTPAADFTGQVTFTYEVSDGSLSDYAVFTILVDPENDAPVAADSTAATAEDTPVAITLVATDVDGDDLEFSVVSQPANGTVVCSVDGSCTYTPSLNFNGTDAFTWSVTDGNAASTATVTITVSPVNDAPQAFDVAATTDQDQAVTFTLPATDADGDAITFTLETTPAIGTVSIAGDQATYTPPAGVNGTTQFLFRATDPHGAFTVAKATIVIDPIVLTPTVLVGEAATVRVQIGLLSGPTGLSVLPIIKARLTTAAGVPVAGRAITFRAGIFPICSAVTDSNGNGSCGGNMSGLVSVLSLGYQVTFDGDTTYAASTARGPLVQVLTLKL